MTEQQIYIYTYNKVSSTITGNQYILPNTGESGNSDISILFRNIETSFSFPPKEMTAERNGNGLLEEDSGMEKLEKGSCSLFLAILLPEF